MMTYMLKQKAAIGAHEFLTEERRAATMEPGDRSDLEDLKIKS
jgi:hypothetical protein